MLWLTAFQVRQQPKDRVHKQDSFNGSLSALAESAEQRVSAQFEKLRRLRFSFTRMTVEGMISFDATHSLHHRVPIVRVA